jgi:ubiquinone/menaquinone biosynthesis C-methylase UbiE
VSEADRASHAKTQAAYFNERSEFFLQPIPEEVRARTREIIHAPGLTPLSRVLDVGTGAGVLVEHILAAGVPAHEIVGCDLSASMLANARAKYPGVEFWQGDVVDLPESFGSFDAVFINACFGNFFDQEKVIDRLSKLLSENGCIVVSHPLGAQFVAQLHAAEPHIVPHLLPDAKLLESWAVKYGLSVEQLIDEPKLYLALMRRTA